MFKNSKTLLKIQKLLKWEDWGESGREILVNENIRNIYKSKVR